MRLRIRISGGIALLLLGLVGGLPAGAQSTPVATPTGSTNTFSLNASAVDLARNGTSSVGTLLVGGMHITPNFGLRTANLVVPAAGLTSFMGGFEYALPVFGRKLNNMSPNLDGNRFQFGIDANVGVDRVSDAAGNVRQHIAFMGGGYIGYDPTASGHFTIKLVEVDYAKLPQFKNNTVIVATGISLNF